MARRRNQDTAIAARNSDVAHVEQACAEYVNAWNHLISTTNWEKGRIIFEWRQALIEMQAPAASYSDETWSSRAGSVSPQHVGRLRRVYTRFHDVYDQYPGLYWSHFQAALDWDDAEMWLEGAVQSGWSVAAMRAQRWEATDAPADQKPREEEIVAAELDEDVDPADDSVPAAASAVRGEVRPVEDVEDDEDWSIVGNLSKEPDSADRVAETAVEPLRPFEDLPALPGDLSDAFEAFKLAILHHRLDGWREVSCRQVLKALDALKQLAAAPADRDCPNFRVSENGTVPFDAR